MKGEINIRLTNRALFVVLAALGLAWLLIHVTHIFVVLFLAVLLASSVSLASARLGRFGVKRGVAILLVYLLVLAMLGGIVALLIPLVTGEIKLLQGNLSTYEEEANALLARLPQQGGAPLEVRAVFTQLGSQLNGVTRELSRGVLRAGSTLVTVLLIFVIAFFMAVDPLFPKQVVGRFFPPTARARTLRLMETIGSGLGHWVRAQLLLALFFGFTFGIGLVVMRMPFALTLGTIGAVLEIIPYVGGFVTIALTILVALTTGKLWLLIAAVVWYVVVVNVEAHIVAPKLVGEIVGLQPLVVVLALFLGAEFLGILGALLAVPLAVIVQAVLNEFWTFDETGAEVAMPPLPSGENTAFAPATATATED